MTGATISPVIVKMSADLQPLEAALAEFGTLFDSAPERVAENHRRLGDVFEEFFCIGPNDRTASIAGEVVVRLEPTDFFLRLLAALRAGDWDRLSSESEQRGFFVAEMRTTRLRTSSSTSIKSSHISNL